MKKIIIAFAFIYSSVSFSQMKITGKLVNQKNESIDLVEVLLLDKNLIVQKSELTNSNGEFTLIVKKGSYFLNAKQLDKIIWKQEINVSDDMNMGIITIIDGQERLTEVIVKNKKNLIERKVDRLVFNVENSISGSTGDALDALRVIPNVRVQNETISLVGKNSLQIMVDDIAIQLSQTDMINYLKSLPANDIKSIEVITAPSSKYDSSGNSGIINIKLKKIKKDSWNASLNSSYTQKTYAGGSIGESFSYKKNKLSIYNSINYRNGTKLSVDNNSIFYIDETWNQNNPRKINDKILNGRFGLDYEITKKWISGFQYVGSTTKSNTNESSLSTITNNIGQQVSYYILSKAKYNTKPKLNSLNWHNIFSLDTIGRKISMDLNYFESANKNYRDYYGNQLDNNSVEIPNTYFAAINSNNQNIKNFSGKVDFVLPTKLVNIDFGAKVSKSITNNDVAFYNNDSGDAVLDENQTNIFEYKEQIQAVYLSGNRKFGSKWESQIGIRVESTQTKGFSRNLNATNKNDYAKLFPTAYLTYTPNENHNFALSYSKRIVRPNYQQLNPFRMYDSPFVYSEGNPYLQPSFTNNFEFTYSYKKLENKIYVSSVTNDFEQIGVVEPNSNITRYYIDNFLSSQNYGISESFTFDKIKWWNSILTFNLNYFQSKSKLKITDERNQGINTFISSNNDFILNKDQTFLFNIMYWYNFPGAFGIYKNTASSSLSLSAKYLFLNKNLQLSVIGNDVFSTQRPTFISYVNDIRQEYRNYYDSRSLVISMLYKFGNKKIVVKPRNFGNEEEKNRAN